MAAHDLADRCAVGRAADGRVEDGSDLAKVRRTEDAGGDDRERFRVAVFRVLELVDGLVDYLLDSP